MKKPRFIAILLAALVIPALAQETKPMAPQAPQPQNPPQPSDGSFARLSFLSGRAFIQRAAELGSEEAAVNMPVAEGDRLGTAEGRAEIYLAKKTYLRLDNNTKVDFTLLPKKDSSLIRLRQWAGSCYLDVAKLEKEKSIEVLTSDATFYILDEGLYRIDVRENARTEILVFQGLVEASGEEGSILVKKDQRLAVASGRFDGRPAAFFAAADDGFDRWNQDRTSIVHRPYARRYLPNELEDFEGELDEYGDWRYTDEFGYVWMPSAMESGWRPYSWGRWLWLNSSWCWLPYEPWGWSTFHYGYWHWGTGMGWYWIPHNVWGPAWVNWWWDPWYYGWAPMSYWGYPGVLVNNMYYGRGWTGDYPYNSRALTVVRKDQLQAPDVRKAALNPESIKSVGKLNLNKSALSVRPSASPGLKVEPLDGGKVILRKSGEGGPAALPRSAEGTNPAIRTIEPSRSGGPTPSRIVPPAGGTSSGPRNVRKQGDITGYPSSSQITRDRILQGQSQRSIRPGSSLNRTLRYFNGGSSGYRISPSRTPSSSSRGGSSVGSAPRSAPRSSSAPSRSGGSSGSSRSGGSSGSGRSGGSSGGGTIRKK